MIKYIPAIYTKSFCEYLISNGQDQGIVRPPLFENEGEKTQKKTLNELIEKTQRPFTAEDIFMDEAGISLWHRLLREHDAKIKIKYDLFVDLKLSEEQIFRSFRKSYRSLINQYQNQCQAITKNNMTDDEKKEFMDFHIKTSGKITRNEKTWDKQKEAVNKKEAFWCKIDGIAYSLFHCSRDEGLYAVGVYDRATTEGQGVPLSHLIQWEAIKHMKRLGLKWYKLGERKYEGTPKEISISEFKQGFATNIFARYEFYIGGKNEGK